MTFLWTSFSGRGLAGAKAWVFKEHTRNRSSWNCEPEEQRQAEAEMWRVPGALLWKKIIGKQFVKCDKWLMSTTHKEHLPIAWWEKYKLRHNRQIKDREIGSKKARRYVQDSIQQGRANSNNHSLWQFFTRFNFLKREGRTDKKWQCWGWQKCT